MDSTVSYEWEHSHLRNTLRHAFTRWVQMSNPCLSYNWPCLWTKITFDDLQLKWNLRYLLCLPYCIFLAAAILCSGSISSPSSSRKIWAHSPFILSFPALICTLAFYFSLIVFVDKFTLKGAIKGEDLRILRNNGIYYLTFKYSFKGILTACNSFGYPSKALT